MTAIDSRDPNKNPGTCRQTTVLNIAYKGSWRETCFTNSRYGTTRKDNIQKTGRRVENDVTVEILKNRIPTATCKSLSQRTLRLSHLFHTPGSHSLFQWKRKPDDARKNEVLV